MDLIIVVDTQQYAFVKTEMYTEVAEFYLVCRDYVNLT